MANAIIRAILSAGIIPAGNIFVSDKDSQKLAEFAKTGVNTTSDNREIEKKSDIIILAVKPQIMDSVLAELAGKSDKIYISIAAGVTLKQLALGIGAGSAAKIVRAMPNTPISVGCGMTILCPNDNVSNSDFAALEPIFSCAGAVARLDEKHINAAMALSASSPAYFFMMLDAMAKIGENHGIPRDVALTLAANAMHGSARLTLESELPPETLRDNVCSPGGTTIEAVQVLERNGFATMLSDAIDACVNKAKKLENFE